MFRNLIQLYTMLVCFISSVIMITTVAISFAPITDLLITEYKYDAQLAQYDSNSNYMDSSYRRSEELSNLSDSEISKHRITARKNYLRSIYGNAKYTLINDLGWMVSGLLFFLMHWQLYKKNK